jgi:hypothetical protein
LRLRPCHPFILFTQPGPGPDPHARPRSLLFPPTGLPIPPGLGQGTSRSGTPATLPVRPRAWLCVWAVPPLAVPTAHFLG